MLRSWRLQLREAEDAFRSGRLEDAERLVCRGDLQQYRPGKQLAAEVAGKIAERARRRILSGEWSVGWRDLEAACSLGGQTEDLLALRQEMIDHVLHAAETDLAAGEPAKAVSRLESIERRAAAPEAVRTLKEAAQRLAAADKLCRCGQFAEAETQLARAAGQRPDWTWIETQRTACRERGGQSHALSEQLLQAMTIENWTAVLPLADKLLELAPESPLGRDARRRAWAELGLVDVQQENGSGATEGSSPGDPQRGSEPRGRAQVATPPALVRPASSGAADAEGRFMLWVDGVGGYLVCLQDSVCLGLATPGNVVEIPIMGDLSRQHARLRREDGYWIEPLQAVRVNGRVIEKPGCLEKAGLLPLQPVRVNGRLIRGATNLSDGDEIELGEGVRLRFRQPHALSATARLEFLSRHRTEPSAAGILLMAESCVLGPKWQDHVVCREWAHDVVLFRRDERLFCRALGPLEINGRRCEGQTPVAPGAHVEGSDFSFCLQQVA